MTTRIVVLDGITLEPGDNPWTPVKALGDVVIHDGTNPEEVVSRLRGAQVAIVNKVKLTDEIFQQLPELKIVSVVATGYDCVDVRAARARGVPVSNVPTYGTDPVAQYAFADRKSTRLNSSH